MFANSKLCPITLALCIICITPLVDAQEKTVGIIIPLTGAYAHFGEAGRLGLESGLPDAKERGIRFVYEDSEYDAAKAVSAYKKLVEIEKAAAVVVLGSPPSSAVIPLAEAKRIPVFAWTPSKKLTGGRTNTVRLMNAAPEQGEKMADGVRERRYSSVAFVAAQNEFSQSVRDAFIGAFGANSVPFSEEFVPAEQDFRPALSRLHLQAVDAIGVCLNTGQIPAFLAQLRQSGRLLPVFGCHAMSSAAVMKALDSQARSAWLVEGVVTKEFQNAFEKLSPDTSGIWLAAAFHDAAVLFSMAPLDEHFIANVISRPIPRSAFAHSAIVRGGEDTYMDTPLGITSMEAGHFVRE